VCIANWNCKDLLRLCLASLLEEAREVRLEIIVVDNASTDGAAEMVEREFPRVILHRNDANLGFARANNQAAELARGQFLFFLNNDTVVPPGALQRLVEFAQEHPEAGMIGPRLRDGVGHTQVSYRLRPTMGTLLHRTAVLRWTRIFRSAYRRYRREDFDAERTRQVEVLMGAAVLLPREVFYASGGWDEDFTFGGEDLELSARIAREHKVIYHGGVEIIHFGRSSTRQHIGYVSSNMAIGFLRYLRKCGYSERMLFFYKLAITCDAPLQCFSKAIQYIYRRARGHDRRAQKSLLAMRGFKHFMTKGLVAFWKA
jgi:GT2 family glycosyltransferase